MNSLGIMDLRHLKGPQPHSLLEKRTEIIRDSFHPLRACMLVAQRLDEDPERREAALAAGSSIKRQSVHGRASGRSEETVNPRVTSRSTCRN